MRHLDFHNRFKEFWQVFLILNFTVQQLSELINLFWQTWEQNHNWWDDQLRPKRQNAKEQATCERPAVRPDTKYQNKQRLAQLYVSLKNTQIWTTQQGEKDWHSSWDTTAFPAAIVTQHAREEIHSRGISTLLTRFISITDS